MPKDVCASYETDAPEVAAAEAGQAARMGMLSGDIASMNFAQWIKAAEETYIIAVHDEPARDVLEFLGDVLAEPAELATTARAALLAGVELDLHARDVIRDRPALRLVLLLDVRKPKPGSHRDRSNLAALERKLQLLGGFRGGPVPMRPVAGELVAELLDQDGLRLHLGQ